MTERTITEQDVASFREKLDAWAAELTENESAILAMISVRAFPDVAEAEVQGFAGPGQVFEVDDYSFDIEQVLNIGSASSGAGAGKVTFNPFHVGRGRRAFGPGTLDSFVGVPLKP